MAEENTLDLIKGKLLKTAGSDEAAEIAGDVEFIGIYFSAHWCPPCRGFTPALAEYYNAVKGKGHKFEIVFVSSDRDEESFKEYFGEMPWLGLKFSEQEAKAKLAEKYSIRGIPTLVILNKDGSTKTMDGRKFVMQNKDSGDFKWD